jgi:CRISP-associated protein Cas1
MPGDIVPSKSGVIVLSGYGVSLTVSRGHLVVSDGIAAEQRSGRISRVDKQLKRIIVIGRSGFISFDAVQWLNDVGISFIQMDYDSNILLINTVLSGERIALRRAQALAPYTETGIAITRYLLEQKLAGQSRTVEAYDRQTSVDIRRLQRQLADAPDLDTLRLVEAEAAAQYWAAFAARSFPFTQKDMKHTPLHWRTIGVRISPLTNSPRKAVTPFHAMLNYLYALLEGETSIVLRTIGFDPHLGILHSDQEYRRSFASDVVEPVSPDVDRWLLDTVASRSFAAKDFTETNEGETRLTVAIRRLLSETVPLWRRAVAPITVVRHYQMIVQLNGTRAK